MVAESERMIGMVQEQIIIQPCSYKQTFEVAEVAKILQIKRQTLYSALKETKDFKVIKFGRNIRIDRKSFIEWFDGREQCGLPPQTYTAEQIALMLTINIRTAYNLLKSTKEFRVLRIGKSNVRVNKASFDRWYQSA